MISLNDFFGLLSFSSIGLFLFKERRRIEAKVEGKVVLLKTAEFREVRHTHPENKGFYWKNERIDYNGVTGKLPEVVNFQELLKSKDSFNVFVVGSSGHGKSVLQMWIIDQFQDRKKIIYAYKQKDKYVNLGIPVLYLKDHIPNVFAKGSEEQFVQAFLMSYPITNKGIIASQLEPLIREARLKTTSWNEFRDILEEESKGKGLKADVYDTILSFERSLHYDEMFEYDLPEEIVVDFRSLNGNAFSFYGNYLLIKIHKDLQALRRPKTMIVIDEVSSFDVAQQITIPDIARLVGAVGSIMLGEQDLSKLSIEVRGNTPTSFCGRQEAEEDIAMVRNKSPLYQFALTQS